MRALIAVGVTAVLAACGGSAAPVDESLARDLERVGSSSFELAPTAAGTQVMSSLELANESPSAAPAPSPERKRVAQRTTSPQRRQPVRSPEAAPRPVQQAPERVAERAPQPAEALPAPSSAPLGAGPAPPGGWKSVGTVIRNSRVPINP